HLELRDQPVERQIRGHRQSVPCAEAAGAIASEVVLREPQYFRRRRHRVELWVADRGNAHEARAPHRTMRRGRVLLAHAPWLTRHRINDLAWGSCRCSNGRIRK